MLLVYIFTTIISFSSFTANYSFILHKSFQRQLNAYWQDCAKKPGNWSSFVKNYATTLARPVAIVTCWPIFKIHFRLPVSLWQVAIKYPTTLNCFATLPCEISLTNCGLWLLFVASPSITNKAIVDIKLWRGVQSQPPFAADNRLVLRLQSSICPCRVPLHGPVQFAANRINSPLPLPLGFSHPARGGPSHGHRQHATTIW